MKVAKRYARALFQSYSHDALERVREHLKQFAQLFAEHADFRSAVLNPAYRIDQRCQSARDVANKISGGDEKFGNFVSILCENGRMPLLPEIAHLLSEMLDELKKVLSLEVISAFELPSEEKLAYSEKIKNEYGALASIRYSVDPQVLGGVLVRSGDKLYDGSVRGALEKMRAHLTI